MTSPHNVCVCCAERKRSTVLICHTLLCLSTSNRMFINHMRPVTSTHTHFHLTMPMHLLESAPGRLVSSQRHVAYVAQPSERAATAAKSSSATSALFQNTQPETEQVWDTWSPGLGRREWKLKAFKTPSPSSQLHPQQAMVTQWTVSVGRTQELIHHRLAAGFICRVRRKHLNTLPPLHFQTSVPPLMPDSPWCRPVLPRCRCTARRKKRKKEKEREGEKMPPQC